MADNINVVPFLAYGNSIPNIAVHTVVADTNYTILPTDTIIAVTSLTSARSITLPSVASVSGGKQFIIKDESGSCSGSNTITVTGTIDSATNAVLNSAYATLRIYSNGNSWSKIGA